ncbi:MAG TPA: Rieske (2Fe-2S) protein [Chloroflexota bacterium]|jgi:nitrite reductase (NADH) small subunit|nr:Rieske (2Fe-2S) protein [Chloroflexota bacterium]
MIATGGIPGRGRGAEKRRWAVATVEELPPGGRKVVEVAGRSIGLFNVGGTIVAVLNVCPHERVPVCAGRVGGTTLPSPPGTYRWGREGEILACPMHGWEFDLLTGKALAHRRKHLLRFPVAVEDGHVFVTV